MYKENKVSIVIPIYNAELFLNRCLESIVNQTYENLEILLIDDGSSDNTPKLCDQWAQKDARIKVIHKQNEGPGIARNYGIDIATGEYVCFFDSDDYLEPTAIELALNAALETASQAVAFGHDKLSPSGELIYTKKPSVPKKIFEGEEVKKVFLPMALSKNAETGEDWNLLLSSWCSLFSLDAIRQNNWQFVSERKIFTEDFYSITELYGYLSKICVLDMVLYHYIENETSFSKKYNPERYSKINYFFEEMIVLSRKIGCEKELDAPIRTVYLGFIIWALKQIVASKEAFRIKYKNLKNVITDKHLQQRLKLHKYQGENISKKILFTLLKRRMIFLSFVMVRIRNLRKK